MTSLVGGQRLAILSAAVSQGYLLVAVRGVGPVGAGQRPASPYGLSLLRASSPRGALREIFPAPEPLADRRSDNLTLRHVFSLAGHLEAVGQVGIQVEAVQHLPGHIVTIDIYTLTIDVKG